MDAARRDFEMAIYRQCDREDMEEYNMQVCNKCGARYNSDYCVRCELERLRKEVDEFKHMVNKLTIDTEIDSMKSESLEKFEELRYRRLACLAWGMLAVRPWWLASREGNPIIDDLYEVLSENLDEEDKEYGLRLEEIYTKVNK